MESHFETVKNIVFVIAVIAIIVMGSYIGKQGKKISSLEAGQAQIMELEKFRQEVDEVIINRLAGISTPRFDSLLACHRIEKNRHAISMEIKKLKQTLLTADTSQQGIISNKISALQEQLPMFYKCP